MRTARRFGWPHAVPEQYSPQVNRVPGTQPSPARTLPSGVVVVTCVLAACAIAWHTWVMPIGQDVYGLFGNGIDTRVYRGGALAVWHDHPLYAGAVLETWAFTYTPFAALTLLPMAWISDTSAQAAMMVVNVVCLLLLIALSLRAMNFRRDWRFGVVVVAFGVAVSVLEPVHKTLWHGQINLVLAVFVLGCLTLPLGRWRGIGVGLAAGIKLTPLFFLCYFVLVRDRRAAATALVTFAATVVLGFAVLTGQAWMYWTASMEDTERIGPMDWPSNQSINGFVVRLGTVGLWDAPGWTWLPLSIGVAVVGLWAALVAYRRGDQLLAITITGLTSCAVSPFSWGHHWVWVVPLVLILIVRAVDAGARARWTWWPAVLATLLLTFSWYRTVVDDGHSGYRFGSFWLLWNDDATGWHLLPALVGSAAYLLILSAAITFTLVSSRIRTTPPTDTPGGDGIGSTPEPELAQ